MVAREFKRETMKVPLALRLRRLLRWGFLFPVVSLIPILLWYQTGAGGGGGGDRFLGLVETESETVGAVDTVRILSIEVKLGQHVAPGDVLVRLDPAGPALDKALQEARLLDYQQGTLRYRQTLQESERRCRQIVQEAAVALESERMNQVRDEAELAGLKAEMARLQPLIEKRLVSEIELSSLRPKAAALEQTTIRYAPLIRALQARHDQAVEDLREVKELLEETDRAAAASAAALGAAAPSRPVSVDDSSTLRASRAGVVSRIQYQAGDVVVAGEAIVRVTASRSRYILGMLTQRQLLDVAVGDLMQVTSNTDPSQPPLTARVESIDPEVMDLLDPFNPTPRFPLRGRRVRLQVQEVGGTLVPGESVTLRATRAVSGWSNILSFGL